MSASFEKIKIGDRYSRQQLANFWGYTSFFALTKGVFTPKGDNKIILFVTFNKTETMEQYKDELKGDTLFWEGPTNHFAEIRMVENSRGSIDHIHLFCRENPSMAFKYEGEFKVESFKRNPDKPSKFILKRV